MDIELIDATNNSNTFLITDNSINLNNNINSNNNNSLIPNNLELSLELNLFSKNKKQIYALNQSNKKT